MARPPLTSFSRPGTSRGRPAASGGRLEAAGGDAARRWQSEAAFFDAVAQRIRAPLAFDPAVIARYTKPAERPLYNKELRFRLLGDLRDKRVLDVGCGDGENAVLLAALGAQVTGLDLSPEALAVARARAQANRVDSRLDLCCAPLEQADLPARSFDVIWGEAILHHLLQDLDGVIRRLCRWGKPGAQVIFAEPVNFNRALRWICQRLPMRAEATPDERPLTAADIEVIRRHLPDLDLHLFSFAARIDRFILGCTPYEQSARAKRLIVDGLSAIDRWLLARPSFISLGAVAVMVGRVPRPPLEPSTRRTTARRGVDSPSEV